MIIGIGTDLLKKSGIPDAVLQAGDPFREKTFTRKELDQAQERPVPGKYLRCRFAAKEAVFKSLGADPETARLNEIEILDDEEGAPHVTLHGALKQHAVMKKINAVHVSISCDGDYAQAFAISEG